MYNSFFFQQQKQLLYKNYIPFSTNVTGAKVVMSLDTKNLISTLEVFVILIHAKEAMKHLWTTTEITCRDKL